MKIRLYALGMTAVMVSAGIVYAATQAWTYERPMGAVLQILADGSGGCGIFAMDTNGCSRVAWIDSKGVVKHEAVLANSTNVFGLMSCDKSGLLYSIGWTGTNVLISVDKNGVVTTIADPTNQVSATLGIPAYFTSRFSDKKGFFATKMALVAPEFASVVRYSFK